MDWQRARTEEKKSERRDAIYAAALALFKRDGYENVSLNRIAAEAEFTKSNVYRYFSSREEIFLNIFRSLFVAWVEDICRKLRRLPEGEDINVVSKTWVKSFTSHRKFLDLTPFLFVSLEKNSAFEQLLEFKRASMNLLHRVASEIGRIYPELEGEKSFEFLNLSYAATSSYWAANSQNEALKKIYRLPELTVLKPDFERDLERAVDIILGGLRVRTET